MSDRPDPWIEQQPQRQDSLTDQMRTVHRLAARAGCFDAADWLWKNAIVGGPT
jgi:hypothetical protein